MNGKDFVRRLYKRACDYNVFIPDADWYPDETDEPIDQVKETKLQKHATRLYVCLFICEYRRTDRQRKFLF